MVKDKLLKVRVTEFEKNIVKELSEVLTKEFVRPFNESDVVRYAISILSSEKIEHKRVNEIFTQSEDSKNTKEG